MTKWNLAFEYLTSFSASVEKKKISTSIVKFMYIVAIILKKYAIQSQV